MPIRITFALMLVFLCACARLVPAVAQDKGDAVKKEQELFKGVWTIASHKEPTGKGQIDKGVLTYSFREEKLELRFEDRITWTGTYTLDPSRRPKTIDIALTESGNKLSLIGIYEFENGTLKLCFNSAGQQRPMHFDMTAKSPFDWAVLKKGAEVKKNADR